MEGTNMAANLRSLLQYWRNFDIGRFQKELDIRATELADRQDESDTSRKKLVELSRDFKKSTQQEIRTVVAPLLKSFQAEIDNLTRRSKAAEAAFLDVYKKLIEVPDCVTYLEYCLSLQHQAMRAQEVELDNQRLRQTLSDYNRELDEVKSQETTIQELRDKLREYEAKIEILSQSIDSRSCYQRQIADSQNCQEGEEKQSALDEARVEVSETKTRSEDGSARLRSCCCGQSKEMEVVINDLEKANQRAAQAEKEVTQLREQLAAAKHSLQLADQIQKAPDMERAVDIVSRSSLQVELASKENEITQLMEDIQQLQSSLNTLKETSASKIAQLEGLMGQKDKVIDELGSKLMKQNDYEDIKKELSLLKSAELGNHPPWPPPLGGRISPRDSKPSIKSLEMLLMTKSKGLNPDNLKINKTDATGSPGHAESPGCVSFPTFDSFSTLLGDELACTTYNKSTPKKDGESSPTRTTDETKFSELNKRSLLVRCPTLEKLQICLRHNIDKYANETLNTLNISRCVRELLSVHNIGQRLFAKYVLGLSQGTVSELLSKPKPWDKLTEKGRDSYRKMHAWAMDEHCIYMLRELVPKKGKEAGISLYKQDDNGSDERISQILTEAHIAMGGCNKRKTPPIENGNVSDNKYTDETQEQEFDSSAMDLLRKVRKYDNDDIPQEMVAKIYQEELAKLRGQRVIDDGYRPPTRDQYERTQEEIRQALSIYHQELSRLSQMVPPLPPGGTNAFHRLGPAMHGALVNGSASCGVYGSMQGSPTEEGPIDATVQNRGRQEKDQEPEGVSHHGSAFSLVRPKTEPSANKQSVVACLHNPSSNQSGGGPPLLPLADVPPVPDDLSNSASPLQRMQSITNSLLSQTALPTLPTPPQRPSKAVLPPITQQQFDQYNNVNTEEIVKRVKEQLSQYSISQRLFGENVLGLSQGSVSDLLARPKPWHMLTQKGREPFIRMKIFLEDDNAVHRLVASQYKIAPEKLMRTGNYACHNPPTAINKLPPQRTTDNNYPRPDLRQNPSSGYPVLQDGAPSTPEAPGLPASPTSNCAARRSALSPRSINYMQPSVYEMAALTTDLDTQTVTSRIKESLMAHNIGQKVGIFGEAVLGLSQGSVSELLSKPKPWHMLSIKGREPFIRMQLWLSDPHNVEKLQALKNERREANKRRRNNSGAEVQRLPLDNHVFNFAAPPSPYPPAKKPRVLFTDEQKEALRLAFSLDPYPSTATIEFLANELNLSVRTITNWFHNHRMRMKQFSNLNSEEQKQLEGAIPTVREGMNFDPVQFRMLLNQRLAELCREPGYVNGLPYMYSPYRNCSPISSHEGDEPATLDLSMSSQQATAHSDVEGGASKGEGSSSNSSDQDDSNFSAQDQCSDHEVPPTPQAPSNSSKRRKPAAPQWVDPGLEMSADSDACSEDECDDDDKIINGVCVRQTDDFRLRMLQNQTVRVDPAPPTCEFRQGGDSTDTEVEETAENVVEEEEPRTDGSDSGEERQNSIDKLQQKLDRQDDSVDWEF